MNKWVALRDHLTVLQAVRWKRNQLTGSCGCASVWQRSHAQISQDATHNSQSAAWSALCKITFQVQPALSVLFFSLCVCFQSVLSSLTGFFLQSTSPLLSPSHILTHICTLTYSLTRSTTTGLPGWQGLLWWRTDCVQRPGSLLAAFTKERLNRQSAFCGHKVIFHSTGLKTGEFKD